MKTCTYREYLACPELGNQPRGASPQLAVQVLDRSGSVLAGRRKAACAKGHHDVRMEPVFRLAKYPLGELRERLLLADVVGKVCRAATGGAEELVQRGVVGDRGLAMCQKHIS